MVTSRFAHRHLQAQRRRSHCLDENDLQGDRRRPSAIAHRRAHALGLQILDRGAGRLITRPNAKPIVRKVLRQRRATPCRNGLQAIPAIQSIWEINGAYGASSRRRSQWRLARAFGLATSKADASTSVDLDVRADTAFPKSSMNPVNLSVPRADPRADPLRHCGGESARQTSRPAKRATTEIRSSGAKGSRPGRERTQLQADRPRGRAEQEHGGRDRQTRAFRAAGSGLTGKVFGRRNLQGRLNVHF